MDPVLPAPLLLGAQAQVEFVDQGRRLQHSGIPLPPQVGGRDLAQVGIDQRHELLESLGLPVLPLGQEPRDLA